MAINPEIMAVQRNSHDRGADLVPHTFHARQSLPDPAAESRAFFSSLFAKNSSLTARGVNPDSGSGATYKKHVRVGGTRDAKGRIQPSRTFMLKPYYEELGEWEGAYGGYPLPGWAEMAIQAMLHAGDLGHMAMRVHSHLPSTGAPILAVELEPGMFRINSAHVGKDKMEDDHLFDAKTGWGRVTVSNRIRQEAAKLAAFDYLINNQDRHGGNLLFRPVDEDGEVGIGDLLAIDHGRSMHYSSINRFAFDHNSRGRDHLFNYFQSPGFSIFELTKGRNMRSTLDSVSDWWKQNGKKIRSEFNKQIRGIKVVDFANHIERHFNLRAKALDNFVKTYSKKGTSAYRPSRPDKVAYGQLYVPVGDHDPGPGWASNGMNSESWNDGNVDVCPTCGECLSCNPHTPGKGNELSQSQWRKDLKTT